MSDAVSGEQTTVPGGAAAGHWVLDPGQSSAGFRHKTMWGLATVRGQFSGLSGDGDLGADGSVTGKIEIPAASVDTKHQKRDKHLRSADFFNADAHPSITFTAAGGAVGASGDLLGSGELTAGGTSRPLSVTARLAGVTADSATLTAELDVDRADFGMTWNMLGTMKGLATVSVTARFTRQPA
jgi:polyisoprenoid-binding protein YceI